MGAKKCMPCDGANKPCSGERSVMRPLDKVDLRYLRGPPVNRRDGLGRKALVIPALRTASATVRDSTSGDLEAKFGRVVPSESLEAFLGWYDARSEKQRAAGFAAGEAPGQDAAKARGSDDENEGDGEGDGDSDGEGEGEGENENENEDQDEGEEEGGGASQPASARSGWGGRGMSPAMSAGIGRGVQRGMSPVAPPRSGGGPSNDSCGSTWTMDGGGGFGCQSSWRGPGAFSGPGSRTRCGRQRSLLRRRRVLGQRRRD